MKSAWWMVGGAVATWVAVAAVPGVDSDVEILFGMLAPLMGAVATWVLVVRTYPASPERLTPRMVMAFGGKVVFFGVYVTVMLAVLSLRPIPFVVSFTAYFVALHFCEAVCLQRFFANHMPAADGAAG
ncbi:MAG: hypothetical protein O2930_03930 [Acidobacteria bacterium]|nr:hypothetical protein [Acidobacteriota bacterium]